jgi:hypothetical protein
MGWARILASSFVKAVSNASTSGGFHSVRRERWDSCFQEITAHSLQVLAAYKNSCIGLEPILFSRVSTDGQKGSESAHSGGVEGNG